MKFKCACTLNCWAVFQMDDTHGVCVCTECNTRVIFEILTITFDC